ncbi:hypothetical protein ABZY09_07710 [Streptomyces sp. NPDC002928]|uniref:hypothetical protein n=1 Tax=Streptomyces sp. NPDC002928 TaxID=3154440 RepID=UPI0033BE8940
MGDRHSEGGALAHRRAGAGGRAPHADSAIGSTGLESALRHALRADAHGASGEQRAVAAFRAARDAGLHKEARTLGRDDRRVRRSPLPRRMKATVALFVVGLSLGGVAIAAIGSPDSAGAPQGDSPGRRHPSPTAPQPSTAVPEAATSPDPATSATPDRPPTAKDIQAHCRAYASVEGRGKAVNSTAWQRLVTAAGGSENVAAYCADQLAQTPTQEQTPTQTQTQTQTQTGAAKANGKSNTKSDGKEPGH